jgi:hypothetical protein
MPEGFRRASIPLDSRLRGNDGLQIRSGAEKPFLPGAFAVVN